MITAKFTDPQGQTWENAKLRIFNFNMNANISLGVTHRNNGVPDQRSNTNCNVVMQVVYWPNQAAIDNGHVPYILDNLEDEMDSLQFRFDLAETIDSFAELETACETHLVNVILPPMQSE
jgi:hypothetical protein